jgi:hypothetical protein
MEVVVMKKLAMAAFAVAMLAVGSVDISAQMTPTMADHEEVEFTATVVDMSCKLVYNLSGEEMHRMCAQVCADNGIPLGLLAEDGTYYLPVSAGMPGAGSNEMLRGHAEHTVTVKGKVISRAGMNSIVIESVSMQ